MDTSLHSRRIPTDIIGYVRIFGDDADSTIQIIAPTIRISQKSFCAFNALLWFFERYKFARKGIISMAKPMVSKVK